MTTRDKLSDFLLNLIPFRAAYVALRNGNIAGGLADALVDTLSFLPAVHQSLKLARVLARTGSTAFRQAARAFAAGTGVRQAIGAGAGGAAILWPDLARRTMKTLWTGLDGALPVPFARLPPLPGLSTGAGPAQLNRLAAQLDRAAPALATRLRTGAALSAETASSTSRGTMPTTGSRAGAQAGRARPGAGLGAAQIAAYGVERPAGLVRMANVEETVFLNPHGSERYIDMLVDGRTYSFKVKGDTTQGWHISAPGKAAPEIRVEFRDGGWQLAATAGLPGGAPIRRLADARALEPLDVSVPRPYSHATPADGTRLRARNSLRVSQTRTVADTARILRAARDITLYPEYLDSLPDMLRINYRVKGAEYMALARAGVLTERRSALRRNTLDFYRRLYTGSPTFRGLFNKAVHDGRIDVDTPWTITLRPPEALRVNGLATYAPDIAFTWRNAKREMDLPPLHAPPADDLRYLTPDGTAHIGPAHVHVHTLVHALTGIPDPDIRTWFRRSANSAGPSRRPGAGDTARAGDADEVMEIVEQIDAGARGSAGDASGSSSGHTTHNTHRSPDDDIVEIIDDIDAAGSSKARHLPGTATTSDDIEVVKVVNATTREQATKARNAARASAAVPSAGTIHWNFDTISRRGMGERGAVEFLAQRILQEAGMRPLKRLSMVPLVRGGDESRIVAKVPTALDKLASYVEIQDRYLETLLSGPTAHPVPRPAPIAEASPSTGALAPLPKELDPISMIDIDRSPRPDAVYLATGQDAQPASRPSTPVTPLTHVP